LPDGAAIEGWVGCEPTRPTRPQLLLVTETHHSTRRFSAFVRILASIAAHGLGPVRFASQLKRPKTLRSPRPSQHPARPVDVRYQPSPALGQLGFTTARRLRLSMSMSMSMSAVRLLLPASHPCAARSLSAARRRPYRRPLSAAPPRASQRSLSGKVFVRIAIAPRSSSLMVSPTGTRRPASGSADDSLGIASAFAGRCRRCRIGRHAAALRRSATPTHAYAPALRSLATARLPPLPLRRARGHIAVAAASARPPPEPAA